MNTLALYSLSQRLREFENLRDKAVFLDAEDFTEAFYTLIATGKPLDQLAYALGLDSDELDYVLKRTPAHQQRLLSARAVAAGSKALDELDKTHFREARHLDSDENNAAKHHVKLAELGLKSAGALPEQQDSSRVVVHNTIQVLNANTPPPPMPLELNQLLEGHPDGA